MKRNGDIVSLFSKHAAKKAAAALPSSSVSEIVAEEEPQVQEGVTEETVNPVPSPPPPPLPVYDINRLPRDPGERQLIQSYPINDQDAIRRAYIELIFLEVHSNHMHMNFQKDKLEIESVTSILYGSINIIGSSIVPRRILVFALYAICSETTNVRAREQINLFWMVGEIGI